MRLSFDATPITVKKTLTFQKILVMFLLFFSHSSLAAVIPVDLNDFFQDPSSAITISAGGESALLSESASAAQVSLVNDPGEGDPEVIVASAGTNLVFDYVFSEFASDDNYFNAFVLDGDSGLSFGAGFEFLTSVSMSGSISFDLTSLVGELLGLHLELGSNVDDGALTATVNISNVRLERVDAEVSEPMILLLFSLGLIIMALMVEKTGNRRPLA